MAFLATTPQEEIRNVVDQSSQNLKQAALWWLVIGVIVVVILFAGKK